MGRGNYENEGGWFARDERTKKKREAMRKYSKWRKQQDDEQQKEYIKRRMRMRRRRNERKKLIGRIRFLYIPTATCVALGLAMIFGSTIQALGNGTILWEKREDFHIAGPIVTGVGILFLMFVSGLSNYHLEKMKKENSIRQCKYCARIKGLDVSDSSDEDDWPKNQKRKSLKTDETDNAELSNYKHKHDKRRPSYVMKESHSGIYHVVKKDNEDLSEKENQRQKRKHSHYKTSYESELNNLETIDENNDDDLLIDDSHDTKHKHQKRKTSYMCKEDEFGLYHVIKTNETEDDILQWHNKHHIHRFSHRRVGSDSNLYHAHQHQHHHHHYNEHSDETPLVKKPRKSVTFVDTKNQSSDKGTQTDMAPNTEDDPSVFVINEKI